MVGRKGGSGGWENIGREGAVGGKTFKSYDNIQSQPIWENVTT